ncbi:hypothetical protein [Streptomyces sp. E2N166]|uniref:hypothetical protein n=1 Tax=Streptomyces sp. E2N166 TaxID=1851909 RepID=UPI0012919BFD|nr:hypothetical protein [Streptomyces sp. E2N166]
MSDVVPGFLTAHERYLARVEWASGGEGTLTIEDVQFLYPPHQVAFPFLRQKNPVVQHFFVPGEHDRLEVAYHPGLATRAGHTAEDIALTLYYARELGGTFARVRNRRAVNGVRITDFETGHASGFSYHAKDRIEDGAHAALYGFGAGRMAWRGYSDGSAALRSLTEWAQGRDREKGYYVVQDDRLTEEVVIRQPIHFNDLRSFGT